MGRRFSGAKRGGRSAPTRYGGGNEASDQRLRDRDYTRQPIHVSNGFPHFSHTNGNCLCLGPCCFGRDGCICTRCPCDKLVGHALAKLKRCFACGEPATTTVEGENACSGCAIEFKELMLA